MGNTLTGDNDDEKEHDFEAKLSNETPSLAKYFGLENVCSQAPQTSKLVD
jgi:hypothetical protein